MHAPINRLWINTTKRRYYRAYLSTDLFGQTSLHCSWGSLDSSQGGTRLEQPEAWNIGLKKLEAIHKRREQHGYIIKQPNAATPAML